jgi:hypothetical protein
MQKKGQTRQNPVIGKVNKKWSVHLHQNQGVQYCTCVPEQPLGNQLKCNLHTLACPTALDVFFEPRFSPFPATFGSPSPTNTGLTPNPPSCSGALPRVELVALLFSWKRRLPLFANRPFQSIRFMGNFNLPPALRLVSVASGGRHCSSYSTVTRTSLVAHSSYSISSDC